MKIFTLQTTKFSYLLLIVLAFSACEKEEVIEEVTDNTSTLTAPTASFSADVPLKWNELYLDLERFTSGYVAPISARANAYINLAAYEVALSGMSDDYRSFEGYYDGLDLPDVSTFGSIHYPTAVNAAYETSMRLFFPTAPAAQIFKIVELANEINEPFKNQLPIDVFARSRNYGREVAEAVFKWSATDVVGHNAYRSPTDPSYIPPVGRGKWRPTPPDFKPALLPNWGRVRTFAADARDIAIDPLVYSDDQTSAIYQQAKETELLTNEVKARKRPEDQWIADFWSDDCPILTFSPAARFVAVANQVIAKEKPNLAKALETYARLGMALCDAGIRCWHEKYRFNYERPVDYIRRVIGNQKWNTVMCPDGSGNYFTPPFPAYPSGHAAFGAAAAIVLTDIYGENYSFTDRCHEGRREFISTPRSFNSFFEMAEENAYSRIPLGVHFAMDSDEGLKLGYGVGAKINTLPWRK
jgi:hypothetical protein